MICQLERFNNCRTNDLLHIMDFIKDSNDFIVENQSRPPQQQQFGCCYKTFYILYSRISCFISNGVWNTLKDKCCQTIINLQQLLSEGSNSSRNLWCASLFGKVYFFLFVFFVFFLESASDRTECSLNVGPRRLAAYQLCFLFIHVSCAPTVLQSSSALAEAAVIMNHSRKGGSYKLKHHVDLVAFLDDYSVLVWWSALLLWFSLVCVCVGGGQNAWQSDNQSNNLPLFC